LVNGGESDPRLIRQNSLGPVSVMGIEIPNGDALDAVPQSIERCNRDVIEITKTHRALAGGVMPGRPHQAESALAGKGSVRYCHSRTRGACGMRKRVGVGRAIRIEILPRICDVPQMFLRMCEKQHLVRRFFRNAPLPLGVPFLQDGNAAFDSLRTLDMAGASVFDGTRIVKDEHRPEAKAS